MPLLETKGAASAQGFGLTLQQTAANYIEDVFSTWLYTGNGSTQTINNGIDLAGEGGLVWTKARTAAYEAFIYDTVRGANNRLVPSSTAANATGSNYLNSFNSNGFTLGSNEYSNFAPQQSVSWTFRKQPKFFDVVTYTGNGATFEFVAHNLQSPPGAIFIKATSTTGDWFAWCRTSPTDGSYLKLNSTAAQVNTGNAGALSYAFPVGTSLGGVNTNASGVTYVAYLFASDAGGFGLSGTDNVISCGSYTGNGSNTGPVINLGYEPQFVMIKNASGTGSWNMLDVMRGMPAQFTSQYLRANAADAEATSYYAYTNATGFQIGLNNSEVNTNASTYIYIAIRRGPMKTPTSGTSVFAPVATSAATGTKLTTNFPVDLQIFSLRTGTTNKNQTVDRLRGVSTNATEGGAQLITSSNAAETTASIPTLFWDNTGFQMPSSYGSTSEIFWNFRRAPGFFDEVCYTGTGADIAGLATNLGVQPELVFLKRRNSTSDWGVGIKVGSSTNYYSTLRLNSTAALGSFVLGFTSTGALYIPSGFSVSGGTYVAYLFASCPGVSKVGSFTGTSATQVINCGFTAGARFVLIKTTSGTGDWYVWDSARGIVAGNDPYLLLNSTAAEVTTTDWVDTAATGFELTGGANFANIAGATYIFLAIA